MRQIYYGLLRFGVASRLVKAIRAEQRHAAGLTEKRRGILPPEDISSKPVQINRAGLAGEVPRNHCPSGTSLPPAKPSTCQATSSAIPRGRRSTHGACRFPRPLRGLPPDKPVLPRRHRGGTPLFPFRDMPQYPRHTNTRSGIGKPSFFWKQDGGASDARHGLLSGGGKEPAMQVWPRPWPLPATPAHSANALPPPCGDPCCRLFPSSFLWAGCPWVCMAHEEIDSDVPQSAEIGMLVATAHHSSRGILWFMIAIGGLPA